LACFAAASPAAADAAGDGFVAAVAGVAGAGVEGAVVEGAGVEGAEVAGVSPICPSAAENPPATGNSHRQTAAATLEKRIYHP
jgi:hypothetical protein